MKKNLLRIATLSMAFAIGTGLSLNALSKPTAVFAVQHENNYAEYTYSGSYYSSVTNSLTDGLNGTLRKKLSSFILPKTWYTYSGSSTGTLGKVLQDADEDPTNSSNMVLFYSRDSISKRASGGSTTDWNREHVWPQSLSNGHWGKDKAGADLLHIRPTWYTTNNKRGSTVYGDAGKKGALTYEGMVYAYSSGSRFEPIDAVKGDVARILMYVWTAYYEYYKDTSLYLTAAIESYDTLLKWHTLDKPDALEGKRNDFSEQSDQKNRNPFVDHPEYAWKIFGGSVNSATILSECKTAYPDTSGSGTPPTSSSSSSSSSESLIPSSSSIISSSEESSSSVSSESSSSLMPSSSSSSESSSVFSSSSESSSVISSSENSSSSSAVSSEIFSSSISTSSDIEPSSIITSSETPSSEQNSSSSNNQSSEPKKSAKGCGSVIGTISLASLTALIGLIFVLSKKER